MVIINFVIRNKFGIRCLKRTRIYALFNKDTDILKHKFDINSLR